MDPPLGIDVARRLREIGYKGTIVFCPLRWILHRTALKSVHPVICSSHTPGDVRANHAPRTVSDIVENTYAIKIVRRCCTFPREEIMYVESHNSQCILHQAGQKTYTLYKSSARLSRN